MSALSVTAYTTEKPGTPLSTGHVVVDSDSGYVNLDLGQAIPRRDHEAGARWVSLHPTEARALAAALIHFAKEVER